MGVFVNDGAFDPIIRREVQAQVSGTGLSPDEFFALVKGVIAQESRFTPTAYHFDGPDKVLDASYGLMQVEGRTAVAYGVAADAELYDPALNVHLGVRVLSDNLRRTNGDVNAAVSAYNGGFRPAYGFGTPLPNGNFGNQAYVSAVVKNWAAYLNESRGTGNTVTTQAGFDVSGLPWWAWVLALGGALGIGWLTKR